MKERLFCSAKNVKSKKYSPFFCVVWQVVSSISSCKFNWNINLPLHSYLTYSSDWKFVKNDHTSIKPARGGGVILSSYQKVNTLSSLIFTLLKIKNSNKPELIYYNALSWNLHDKLVCNGLRGWEYTMSIVNINGTDWKMINVICSKLIQGTCHR